MLFDFEDLKRIVQEKVIDRFDHTDLNEVVEFPPTAELMALEIYNTLKAARLDVERVALWETPTSFAFTVSVPLILLGNGLGAFIVRYITIHGTKTVKKYRFLKNGAMYSIGLLGLIMLGESLSAHIPIWLPTAITIIVVGIFFWLSDKELKARNLLPN